MRERENKGESIIVRSVYCVLAKELRWGQGRKRKTAIGGGVESFISFLLFDVFGFLLSAGCEDHVGSELARNFVFSCSWYSRFWRLVGLRAWQKKNYRKGPPPWFGSAFSVNNYTRMKDLMRKYNCRIRSHGVCMMFLFFIFW